MSDRATAWVGRLLSVAIFLGAAGYMLHRELPKAKHDLHGYTFSETLPKAIDAAGPDARVVSILDQDGNLSYALLTGDGRVQERYYGETCTTSSKGNHCVSAEKHRDRAASARERDTAVVRLGDLDPGLVERLRERSGVAKAASVGLRGRMWAMSQAGTERVADADGGHIRPASTAAEQAVLKSVSEDSGLR
jgi:hypothetical protein